MQRAMILGQLTNPVEIERLCSVLRDIYRRIDTDTVTTTDPNGSVTANKGSRLILESGGIYYYCINIDGGTTWQKVAISGSGTPTSVVYFSFTATAGQTAFTLSSTPNSSKPVVVFIEGTAQNKSAGDYTVAGAVITLNSGVPAGYKVYGYYEV
jgi:hypothetical protein